MTILAIIFSQYANYFMNKIVSKVDDKDSKGFHKWNELLLFSLLFPAMYEIRMYAELLNIWQPSYILMVGCSLILYVVWTTLFHIKLHGKERGWKYYGDGKNSSVENFITWWTGYTWDKMPRRWEYVSLAFRFIFLSLGIILIAWGI